MSAPLPQSSDVQLLWMSGRDDRLTEACFAWGARKRRAQPALLVQRMVNIRKKLREASASLEQECDALLGAPSAACMAIIVSLIAEIKDLAAGALHNPSVTGFSARVNRGLCPCYHSFLTERSTLQASCRRRVARPAQPWSTSP